MKVDWRKLESFIADFLKGEGLDVQNIDGDTQCVIHHDDDEFFGLTGVFSVTKLSQEMASDLEGKL